MAAPQNFDPRFFALRKPEQLIRTAQIICGAMIGALVMFLLIVVGSKGQPQQRAGQEPLPMTSLLGLGFAVVMIVLRFIVPGQMIQRQLKSLDQTDAAALDGQLFGLFQIKMIIVLALLEGAGFLNLVAYMTEGQWWSLAVVGILLALMAMMFPTLDRFEAWATDRKRDLQNQF